MQMGRWWKEGAALDSPRKHTLAATCRFARSVDTGDLEKLSAVRVTASRDSKLGGALGSSGTA
jgi:hypothetical protein